MNDSTSLRGNAMTRSLSAVTSALDRVRASALDRALDPRNAAKGPWRDMSRSELFDLLHGEVMELEAAVMDREPFARILSEAGDVVWVVAMIVDREAIHAR